jgi:hypothetical protein
MGIDTHYAGHQSARTRMACPGQVNGHRRHGLMREALSIMILTGVIYASVCVYQVSSVYSAEMSEDMQQMQMRLNNEVLSKPFSVADEAQVKAYIEGAQKRGEVPQPYTGQHWRPGYTCIDLRSYSYQEYLSCRYYHAYYGHYYR